MVAGGKIVKNIETRVCFTNEEIRDILQKAAGAPEGAKGMLCLDQESFYADVEIVWWEQTEQDRQP